MGEIKIWRGVCGLKNVKRGVWPLLLICVMYICISLTIEGELTCREQVFLAPYALEKDEMR